MSLVKPSKFDYLNGLNEDDTIYRYCSIFELYRVINKKKLTLVCPFSWEDLFENPLMRAELVNRKGQKIDLGAEGKKLFCQCWTLENESNAMWKLYGYQGKGVRISAKVSDLYFQAYNSYNIEANEAVYTKIGKIEYLDESELKRKFENEEQFYKKLMESNCEGYYESLLYKRKAFSDEKEVRLIAHDFDQRFSCQSSLKLELSIKTYDWIKTVTLGPAMDEFTAEAYYNELVKLGFPGCKIEKSSLYEKLNYTISLKS